MSIDKSADFIKALIRSYSPRRYIAVWVLLLLSGLLFVLFRPLGVYLGGPGLVIFFFIPLLLSFPILLMGFDLFEQLFVKEAKGVKINYQQISWTRGLSLLPFAFLPLLGFAPFVLALLLFSLFYWIPYAGGALSALLAFVPFLSVLGGGVLFLSGFLLLFVLPLLLKKKGPLMLRSEHLFKEVQTNLFQLFQGFFFAIFPFILSLAVMFGIAAFILTNFTASASMLISLAAHLSLVFPISILLTPFLTLFFYRTLLWKL